MSISRKLSLLEADIQKVQFFLDQFTPCANGKRTIRIEANGEFIIVRNFPLPDKYHPDSIDLVLITTGYPQAPPQGMHVLKNSKNEHLLDQLQNKFGHTYSDAMVSEAEDIDGYSWICVHYQDFKWHFDLDFGDNIYKLLSIFSALLEGEKS